jgi:amino acid permease
MEAIYNAAITTAQHIIEEDVNFFIFAITIALFTYFVLKTTLKLMNIIGIRFLVIFILLKICLDPEWKTCSKMLMTKTQKFLEGHLYTLRSGST